MINWRLDRMDVVILENEIGYYIEEKKTIQRHFVTVKVERALNLLIIPLVYGY